MKRFLLTPRAKQDVNDIWDYIAADNVKATTPKSGLNVENLCGADEGT